MTSQGTAHGRFQRAIQCRHLHAAEMAARELGGLSLADALELTLLMRDVETWRYERDEFELGCGSRILRSAACWG